MLQRDLQTGVAVERLADATLTILERTGVMCQNEELLRALDLWGAVVDYDDEAGERRPGTREDLVALIRLGVERARRKLLG